jgi:hypothetical protein
MLLCRDYPGKNCNKYEAACEGNAKKKLHKKRREKEGRNEASAEEEKISQRKILREKKNRRKSTKRPHYENLSQPIVKEKEIVLGTT